MTTCAPILWQLSAESLQLWGIKRKKYLTWSVGDQLWPVKEKRVHSVVLGTSSPSPRLGVTLHKYIDYCCSVTKSCLTLCNPWKHFQPMEAWRTGFPVLHYLLEFVQTHVHWVSDAIQPSQPLSSPSPPAFNLSQHQDLFQWVSSSHQVAKVLEFQLRHQSFQWIFRTDFL